jgi:hypothetical protein
MVQFIYFSPEKNFHFWQDHNFFLKIKIKKYKILKI